VVTASITTVEMAGKRDVPNLGRCTQNLRESGTPVVHLLNTRGDLSTRNLSKIPGKLGARSATSNKRLDAGDNLPLCKFIA
jgi:hypothetical protein